MAWQHQPASEKDQAHQSGENSQFTFQSVLYFIPDKAAMAWGKNYF